MIEKFTYHLAFMKLTFQGLSRCLSPNLTHTLLSFSIQEGVWLHSQLKVRFKEYFEYFLMAAPLSYTARLCTFHIYHIRFYTLSIAHAPFTTHFDCHSSRYYTPRLPTFRLCTFGHPHLPCYTLLFRHKAIVHNAFATHLQRTDITWKKRPYGRFGKILV